MINKTWYTTKTDKILKGQKTRGDMIIGSILNALTTYWDTYNDNDPVIANTSITQINCESDEIKSRLYIDFFVILWLFFFKIEIDLSDLISYLSRNKYTLWKKIHIQITITSMS